MGISLRTPGVIVALAATTLVAGCGDDEPAAETVPTTTQQQTERTETERTETERTGTTPADTGGQGASPGGGPAGGSPTPNPELPDSPENDLPPPPGSPAERFEQECQVNPASCQ